VSLSQESFDFSSATVERWRWEGECLSVQVVYRNGRFLSVRYADAASHYEVMVTEVNEREERWLKTLFYEIPDTDDLRESILRACSVAART
jgi:hypothetical protein